MSDWTDFEKYLINRIDKIESKVDKLRGRVAVICASVGAAIGGIVNYLIK
jgi:tetrahydromethanopterin S-methyltransferase subunit G